MLSILRIIVGLLYMEHGLAKVLGFPLQPNHAQACTARRGFSRLRATRRHAPSFVQIDPLDAFEHIACLFRRAHGMRNPVLHIRRRDLASAPHAVPTPTTIANPAPLGRILSREPTSRSRHLRTAVRAPWRSAARAGSIPTTLDFIKAQLARIPTLNEPTRTALGVIFGGARDRVDRVVLARACLEQTLTPVAR